MESHAKFVILCKINGRQRGQHLNLRRLFTRQSPCGFSLKFQIDGEVGVNTRLTSPWYWADFFVLIERGIKKRLNRRSTAVQMVVVASQHNEEIPLSICPRTVVNNGIGQFQIDAPFWRQSRSFNVQLVDETAEWHCFACNNSIDKSDK